MAAERLLEEAKALIDDAKIRVDKDETEVMYNRIRIISKGSLRLMSNFNLELEMLSSGEENLTTSLPS